MPDAKSFTPFHTVLAASIVGIIASCVTGAVSVGDGTVGDSAISGLIYGLVIALPVLLLTIKPKEVGVRVALALMDSAIAAFLTFLLVTDDSSTAGIGALTSPFIVGLFTVFGFGIERAVERQRRGKSATQPVRAIDRITAASFDFLTVTVVSLFITEWVFMGFDGPQEDVWTALTFLIVTVLYLGPSIYLGGRSPGQRLLGIQLFKLDTGRPAYTWQVAGRALLSALFIPFVLLAVFTFIGIIPLILFLVIALLKKQTVATLMDGMTKTHLDLASGRLEATAPAHP